MKLQNNSKIKINKTMGNGTMKKKKEEIHYLNLHKSNYLYLYEKSLGYV